MANMHLKWFLALSFYFTSLAFLQAGSSNSLMDVSQDGKWLACANPDNGTVTLFDIINRKPIVEVPVGEKPEGVSWIGGTSLLAVTVYAEDKLVILNRNTGKVVQTMAVPDEPYGVISNKDGSKLYISHEYPGLVSEVSCKDFKIVGSFPAGNMIRGIALSPDENQIYTTEFLTASLNRYDLGTKKRIEQFAGRGDDNLARQVAIHPKRNKAYIPHIRSRVHIIDADGSIFPELTICDTGSDPNRQKKITIAMDTFNGVYVVCNPWECALSPDARRLYVIYAGTNDMNICTVMDDDYSEIRRQGNAIRIGSNPRAIRVHPEGKEVYVYNALDFEVSIHNPETMTRLDSMKSCAPPKSQEWVRGKVLFNTSNPPMTSRRWIACSSCHPDGHPDGRVWQNPEGLRKTPSLGGLAHTHPLHWSADRDESQDFEYTIRGKLMRGFGLAKGSIKPKEGFEKTELGEKLSGRSTDLDAMAIYTNSFEIPLSPHINGPGGLSESALRGKKLFFDSAVACSSCHSGPYYSDSKLGDAGKLHDVGTGKDDESEKMGTAYDTPTLLGVYRTAPYLHHGKANSLMEVLTKYNHGDKHGKTSHLAPSQLEDLVAFIKALPYEKPPSETPNTVKYYFNSSKSNKPEKQN